MADQPKTPELDALERKFQQLGQRLNAFNDHFSRWRSVVWVSVLPLMLIFVVRPIGWAGMGGFSAGYILVLVVAWKRRQRRKEKEHQKSAA